MITYRYRAAFFFKKKKKTLYKGKQQVTYRTLFFERVNRACTKKFPMSYYIETQLTKETAQKKSPAAAALPDVHQKPGRCKRLVSIIIIDQQWKPKAGPSTVNFLPSNKTFIYLDTNSVQKANVILAQGNDFKLAIGLDPVDHIRQLRSKFHFFFC